MSADVRIYTTSWCPYCVQAKMLLRRKRAPFIEVDVEDNAELRSWLASSTGQRTVPQIFINGESVGGFTELAALDKTGRLDEMLAANASPDAVALPG